ncbi:MAG TPA: gamma-glutamylcyclotransferase family protein [Gemmatimonadales bacterium]|nr:gamma-glutamylcyclotransferase family protein [Gemmatimonadales bacterium]
MSDYSLIFVYGILKRGFSADLTRQGGEFQGPAEIDGANLHPIGGGVGLRFTEDKLRKAHGELFLIPDRLWKWLDRIESNGFCYTRKEVDVYTEDGSRKAWVYEHTFPDMKYNEPFEDGCYHGGLGHANI